MPDNAQPSTNEIEIGFTGAMLLFLLRLSCFLQDIVAKVVWFILIKPGLALATLVNADAGFHQS